MVTPAPSRRFAFDDLNARARIRHAALDQFAEHGFERTTIRGIAAAGERGNPGAAAFSRDAIRPFQAYLARALVDGSSTIATLFDQIVEPTEQWIALADRTRPDPPYTDRRTRAAVFTAMVLGVPLLREQLSRVLGLDVLSPEGDRQVALALLDIYLHAV